MQKASSHRAHLDFVQMSGWKVVRLKVIKLFHSNTSNRPLRSPSRRFVSSNVQIRSSEPDNLITFNLQLGLILGQRPNEPGSYTLYAIGCRYYFTPLTGVLFTFPSRYWFTIGRQGVFSLIQWSGRIHAEFHVHRITWDASRGLVHFTHPAVTVSGRFFHIVTFAF